MKNQELLTQFTSDLQIEGCVVQASTLNKVCGALTSETYLEVLKKLERENAYLLGGVDPAQTNRGSDNDILKKNYFFLDFDIREFWKQHYADTEISDSEIQEIGYGIIHSFNQHPLLRRWRYLVFTGGGVHIYFFGDPVAIEAKEWWTMGIKFIHQETKKLIEYPADGSCINPAKISRIPGSYNWKRGAPVLAEILEYQAASFDISLIQKYGKEEMERIKEETKRRAEEVKAKHPDADDTYNVIQSIPIAPLIAQEMGVEVREGRGGKTNFYDPAEKRIRGYWVPPNENHVLRCGSQSLPGSKEGYGVFEFIKEAHQLSNKETFEWFNERFTEVREASKKELVKRDTTSTQSKRDGASKPIIVNLKDVEPEEVTWLWGNRIPLGKITMLDGDPGVGKSWCSEAIACAVTLGTSLPGDEEKEKREPAKVLLLTAEDGLGDTIRPRFDAMGADVARIRILMAVRTEQGEERHLSLETDLAAVEEALSEGGYRLIIIDPLNAYLGTKIDTNRDAALRFVLTPLTKLAERHDVAVLCIRHLTKSGRDKAIYRGQGSIAYTAAARAAHLVGVHPRNEQQRVIACTKINVAEKPPSIVYEIVKGQFRWIGEENIDAEELLGPAAKGEEKSAIDDAKDFLRDLLENGPVPATEVQEEAAALIISDSTLKRAKSQLGITSPRVGGKDGYFVWKLPHQTNKTNDGQDKTWHPLKESQENAKSLKNAKSESDTLYPDPLPF